MNKLLFSCLCLLIISQVIISCENENHKENFFVVEVDSIENNDTTNIPQYSFENLINKIKIHFTAKIIGKGIIDNIDPKFGPLMPDSLRGQGMAIFNNYMFRLHLTGICCIYDLSDIDNIKYVNSYKLGSYSHVNHANVAQFSNEVIPETGFPLLYLSPVYPKYPCVVEKVSLDSSSLVQKIIPTKNGYSMLRDWIIGDDNYLWGIGSDGNSRTKDYTLNYYKLKLPEISEGNITIKTEDAIDYFEDNEDWEDIPSTYQGGMVHKGKLYHLFGTKHIKRELRVYDTKTHKRIAIIDLNEITKEEPEDLDVWQDNKIIISLAGVDHAIMLEFEDNTLFP